MKIPFDAIVSMKEKMLEIHGKKAPLEIVFHPSHKQGLCEMLSKITKQDVVDIDDINGMFVRFDPHCPPSKFFVKKIENMN